MIVVVESRVAFFLQSPSVERFDCKDLDNCFIDALILNFSLF